MLVIEQYNKQHNYSSKVTNKPYVSNNNNEDCKCCKECGKCSKCG